MELLFVCVETQHFNTLPVEVRNQGCLKSNHGCFNYNHLQAISFSRKYLPTVAFVIDIYLVYFPAKLCNYGKISMQGGCILNCFMLLSLPCFPIFCCSAIPTSLMFFCMIKAHTQFIILYNFIGLRDSMQATATSSVLVLEAWPDSNREAAWCL